MGKITLTVHSSSEDEWLPSNDLPSVGLRAICQMLRHAARDHIDSWVVQHGLRSLRNLVISQGGTVASLYLLGYDSALEVYRRARSRVANLPRVDVKLDELSVPQKSLVSSDLCRWICGDDPDESLHVVVSGSSGLRHTKNLVTHSWGRKYNTWPVIRVNDTVCVSSPEFLFLQMAGVLEEAELIFLGCELCGTYGFEAGRVCERQQLTTVEAISRFLSERPGATGSKRARSALRYVFEGSASPIEAELVLRLCLPRRRGGRGIARPQLNPVVQLSGKARSIIGFDHISPDVFWPAAALCMEYDSDAEHTGSGRIARDARRRLVYDAMDIQVITVTNEMLQSPDGFEVLAGKAAQATGKRLRAADWAERCRRQDLWRLTHALATRPELLTWAAHQHT